MYKLTLITATLLASQAVSAAEIYTTETSSVDLYGKVYAGHIYGDAEQSEHYGANQYVRFGSKANSDITDDLSAFMRYEVQMYFQDSEKIEKNPTTIGVSDEIEEINESTGNLRVRLGYAGVKGNWGKVSFGRNYGAVELVSDWTDKSLSDPFGNEALGVGSDTKGTARTSSLLKYQGEFKDLELDASIKLRNTSHDNASSYGLALAYHFNFDVSIGAAYSVEVDDIFDNENIDVKPADPKLILAGIKYERAGFYSALNFAKSDNFRGSDINHTGIEAAVAYSFNNGIRLVSLFNKGKAEIANGDKFDFANSVTAGISYQLSQQFKVLAEYRTILGDIETLNDNNDIISVSKDDDELALAAIYTF